MARMRFPRLSLDTYIHSIFNFPLEFSTAQKYPTNIALAKFGNEAKSWLQKTRSYAEVCNVIID